MIYTSKHFENQTDLPTADRILFFVKSRGAASTAALAAALGMTPEAARQQVQKLVASGLLEGRQEAVSGVGRPRQNWVLTAAGNGRFPDMHAQLTVQMIDSVRQVFGEEGLNRLIAQREAGARATYLQRCDGSSLQQRLEQLAAVRSEEGYMARVERDADDWLLIEDHCPICIAARSCQGFCRSELQLFQEVAGAEAQVRREQHLLAGATRCVYRITGAQPARSA
ncbi:transcriptional regulator [Roseateles sp. DAIF2]|uniref:helix-turn-helix transcriptional regulator n=1 Tax=Roseateles sp. DAIF2 TaxID=2714952 RepID=UPI0018A3344D|nr:transcriptional regulator [Roseateles sp. DAIF2]QPF76105.1 transcriptional regulator [Roseateles sp. DAIF2]